MTAKKLRVMAMVSLVIAALAAGVPVIDSGTVGRIGGILAVIAGMVGLALALASITKASSAE